MEYRPRLSAEEYQLIQNHRDKTTRNVLVIGDVHEPFCLAGYKEHCLDIYHKYSCNRVVFTGDLIDNHYASFHATDPDGFGAGEELERAREKIKQWYAIFPKAIVTIGNHDAIICRKAYANGISRHWIRDYKEVLDTPDWDFVEQFELDGVMYVHGTGTSGRSGCANRALQMGVNCVQGHIHTESSVIYNGNNWGLQVGCGIDKKQYAFAYAKTFPKPVKISCGVVLNNGTMPIVVPMSVD